MLVAIGWAIEIFCWRGARNHVLVGWPGISTFWGRGRWFPSNRAGSEAFSWKQEGWARARLHANQADRGLRDLRQNGSRDRTSGREHRLWPTPTALSILGYSSDPARDQNTGRDSQSGRGETSQQGGSHCLYCCWFLTLVVGWTWLSSICARKRRLLSAHGRSREILSGASNGYKR